MHARLMLLLLAGQAILTNAENGEFDGAHGATALRAATASGLEVVRGTTRFQPCKAMPRAHRDDIVGILNDGTESGDGGKLYVYDGSTFEYIAKAGGVKRRHGRDSSMTSRYDASDLFFSVRSRVG